MQHLSPTPSLRIMHLRIIYVSACLNSFFHFIVAEYVIVHQFPSWGTFGFCFAVVRYYEKCCHKHSHRGFRVGAQRLISLGRIWKSEIAVPCAQGGFAGNCQTSSRPAAWIHTPTGNASKGHLFTYCSKKIILALIDLSSRKGIYSHVWVWVLNTWEVAIFLFQTTALNSSCFSLRARDHQLRDCLLAPPTEGTHIGAPIPQV